MKTQIFKASRIIKYIENLLASDLIIDRDVMGRILWENDKELPISECVEIGKNRYYSQELQGGTKTTQEGRLAGTEWVSLTDDKTPTFETEGNIIYTPNPRSLCIYNLETNVTKRFSTNRRKVGIYHKNDKYHVIVVE